MLDQCPSRKLFDATVRTCEVTSTDESAWDDWKRAVLQSPTEDLLRCEKLGAGTHLEKNLSNNSNVLIHPLGLLLASWTLSDVKRGLEFLWESTDMGSNPWVSKDMPWIFQSKIMDLQSQKPFLLNPQNIAWPQLKKTWSAVFKWSLDFPTRFEVRTHAGLWDFLLARSPSESGSFEYLHTHKISEQDTQNFLEISKLLVEHQVPMDGLHIRFFEILRPISLTDAFYSQNKIPLTLEIIEQSCENNPSALSEYADQLLIMVEHNMEQNQKKMEWIKVYAEKLKLKAQTPQTTKHSNPLRL